MDFDLFAVVVFPFVFDLIPLDRFAVLCVPVLLRSWQLILEVFDVYFGLLAVLIYPLIFDRLPFQTEILDSARCGPRRCGPPMTCYGCCGLTVMRCGLSVGSRGSGLDIKELTVLESRAFHVCLRHRFVRTYRQCRWQCRARALIDGDSLFLEVLPAGVILVLQVSCEVFNRGLLASVHNVDSRSVKLTDLQRAIFVELSHRNVIT